MPKRAEASPCRPPKRGYACSVERVVRVCCCGPSPASVDDVVDRRLLHRPLAAVAVVARQGEAMPVGIVPLHVIAAIGIDPPARLRGLRWHPFRFLRVAPP